VSGFDERLFFEHDLATPLSNLEGARYILQSLLKGPDEEAAEALDILQRSALTIEKMLYWYWETRKIEERYHPAPAWSAKRLPAMVNEALSSHGLPLKSPAIRGGLAEIALTVPEEQLVAALVGAGLSLQAASRETARWEVSAGTGLLYISFIVAGEDDALDPPTFFRKMYWPQNKEIRAPFDAGLPYLTALLGKTSGGRELAWQGGEWRLEAWLRGEEAGRNRSTSRTPRRQKKVRERE
jgi:hypothetical protein